MTVTVSLDEGVIISRALKMFVALYKLDAEALPELHALREDLEETIGQAEALRARLEAEADMEEQIREHYAPPAFKPSDDVVSAVEVLLDVAHETLRNVEEDFDHCLMCDSVDGHEVGCPVPVLKAWQARK